MNRQSPLSTFNSILAIIAVVMLSLTTAACNGDSDDSNDNNSTETDSPPFQCEPIDIPLSDEELSFTYDSSTLSDLDGSSFVAMTRNIYLGADIFPLVLAEDLDGLFDATRAVYDDVIASEFINRARGLAREISLTNPDVVGLQEVTLYQIGPFDLLDNPTTNADCVEFDFLQLLLNALEEAGLNYTVAQSVTNADLELTDGEQDIRLTDRDVLLVRSDLEFEQTVGANFENGAAVLTFNSLINGYGVARFTRGYVAATVTKDGQDYRVYNTHLEVGVSLLAFSQDAQALELAELINAESTARPVIVLGDFNTGPPDGRNYETITNDSGLSDAWAELETASAVTSGQLTCCASDDLLDDADFGSLIDLVLYRDGSGLDLTPQAGIITMQSDSERITTSDGRQIFASDHRGMVVGF